MTSLIASLLGCLFVRGLDKLDLVDLCTPGHFINNNDTPYSIIIGLFICKWSWQIRPGGPLYPWTTSPQCMANFTPPQSKVICPVPIIAGIHNELGTPRGVGGYYSLKILSILHPVCVNVFSYISIISNVLTWHVFDSTRHYFIWYLDVLKL